MKQYACLTALVATVACVNGAVRIETELADSPHKALPEPQENKDANGAKEAKETAETPRGGEVTITKVGENGEPVPIDGRPRYMGSIEEVKTTMDGGQRITISVAKPPSNRDEDRILDFFGRHTGGGYDPPFSSDRPLWKGWYTNPPFSPAHNYDGEGGHRSAFPPPPNQRQMLRGSPHPLAAMFEQGMGGASRAPCPIEMAHLAPPTVTAARHSGMPEELKAKVAADAPSCVVGITYDLCDVPSVDAMRILVTPTKNLVSVATAIKEVRPGAISMTAVTLELMMPGHCILCPKVLEAAINEHKARQELLLKAPGQGPAPATSTLYVDFAVDQQKVDADAREAKKQAPAPPMLGALADPWDTSSVPPVQETNPTGNNTGLPPVQETSPWG